MKCTTCKGLVVLDDKVTIHHIIPRRMGGKKKKIALCRNPCHDIADKIADAIYPQEVKVQ